MGSAYLKRGKSVASLWKSVLICTFCCGCCKCRMLYPSGLAYGPGEKVDPNQQTRTSKGTFLSASMDNAGVLSWVEERIAAASLIPRENGEVRVTGSRPVISWFNKCQERLGQASCQG